MKRQFLPPTDMWAQAENGYLPYVTVVTGIDHAPGCLAGQMAHEPSGANTAGGHLGRSEQWPQRRSLNEAVLPWIKRALAPRH